MLSLGIFMPKRILFDIFSPGILNDNTSIICKPRLKTQSEENKPKNVIYVLDPLLLSRI